MDQKKLKFRISKDGQSVNIEGMGFHGTECLTKAQSFFEKLGSVQSQTLKPEHDEIPLIEDQVFEGM